MLMNTRHTHTSNMMDIHIVVTDIAMSMIVIVMTLTLIAMNMRVIVMTLTLMSIELVVTTMVRASLSASNRLRRQACRWRP